MRQSIPYSMFSLLSARNISSDPVNVKSLSDGVPLPPITKIPRRLPRYFRKGVHTNNASHSACVCWLQRQESNLLRLGYEPSDLPVIYSAGDSPELTGRKENNKCRNTGSKAERTAMQRQSEGDTQTNCTAGKLSDDFRLLSCIHYITYSLAHSRSFWLNFSIARFVFLFIVAKP